MQKYPDTPVTPDALSERAALEKEGKQYSAAQAFAAMVQLTRILPTPKMASAELKKLNQPVDNEEDPLKLVLAENGYGETTNDAGENVLVRQKDSGPAPASTNGAYGSDDLPNLGAAAAAAPAVPAPAKPDNAQVSRRRLTTKDPRPFARYASRHPIHRYR